MYNSICNNVWILWSYRFLWGHIVKFPSLVSVAPDLPPDQNQDHDPEAEIVAAQDPIRGPRAELLGDDPDLIQDDEGLSQDHIRLVEGLVPLQDTGLHVDVDSPQLQGDIHAHPQDHLGAEGKLSFHSGRTVTPHT